MEDEKDIIINKKEDEDIDVTIIEKFLLGVLIFGAIINIGFFGTIFYNQYEIKNEMQGKINKIEKDIHSLNFQASDSNNKTVINKAFYNKLLEIYSKGFDNGYKCGYGFGYIDCHDGRPYSAEIPKE